MNESEAQRRLLHSRQLARTAEASRCAGWLEFGGIDRREDAILGMSAGFSHISIVPGTDDVASSGSVIGGMMKTGCLYFSFRKIIRKVTRNYAYQRKNDLD